MALPNTQKISVDKSHAIKSDWYQAVLIGHVEKDNENVTSSHIEFEIATLKKRVWAVLVHDESDLHRIKRLKQAFEMSDEESDLTPYYNKSVLVYVHNEYKDGKIRWPTYKA